MSDGIYATLNGGIGSKDSAPRRREPRPHGEALGVEPERLLSCYQIHSPKVVEAREPWGYENRAARRRDRHARAGIAIGVSTADCGPVLFADPQAQVIGAAHAGWRGAFGGVMEATVAAMERLGARARASLRRQGR